MSQSPSIGPAFCSCGLPLLRVLSSVKPMAASDSKRDAVEVAARPLRELLREEHDEIAAAQRALRQAEKAHDRAIELAERQLRAAKTAKPLAAYGHHVILYADQVSTADGNHELAPEVRARTETPPEAGRSHGHELTLTIEAPTWRCEVVFPRRDERKVRRLAEQIELAARNVEVVRGAARAETEQADQDLGEALADRRAVQETRALIHQLSDLVHEDEDVIDMAPGISAGHDGVLVATERRLLFISVRRTLSFPYEEISSVELKGKWFGARLALSTPTGRGVVSGLAPQHAAEIADLIRSRIGGEAASV
jgi:Bacterial PH domain